MLLRGDPGVGKSLLLQLLQSELAARGRTALLIPRGDLLGPALETAAGGILLLDEAERADPRGLEEATRRGLQLLLACVGDCLPTLGLDTPALTIRMEPLSGRQSRDFLRDRARRAGHAPRFGRSALTTLADGAQGSPRILRTLAGAALFHAQQDGSPRVEREHAVAALASRIGAGQRATPRPRAHPFWIRPAIGAGAIAAPALAVLAFGNVVPLWSGTEPGRPTATQTVDLAGVPIPVRAPPSVITSPSATPVALATPELTAPELAALDTVSLPPITASAPPPENTEQPEDAYREPAARAELAAVAPPPPSRRAPTSEPSPDPAESGTEYAALSVPLPSPAPSRRATVSVLPAEQPRAEPVPQSTASEEPVPELEIVATRDEVRAARDAALTVRDAIQAARLARGG